MKKIKSTVLTVCTLSVLATACSKLENQLPFRGKTSNKATNASSTNLMLGDDKIQLQAISETEMNRLSLTKNMLSIKSQEARALLETLPQGTGAAESISENTEQVDDNTESLLAGIPFGLIGQQNIFGGVITEVSDKDSETLGGLKLTDLSPIHVKTMVNKIGEVPVITLVGCPGDCDESAEQVPLVNIPIIGINAEQSLLVIDLATLGRELDLISMLDPKGEYTKLKTVSASTTKMEYDLSTLVFDVKTRMIGLDKDPTDATAPVTEFTVRWYLKLGSIFNPAFVPRAPTEGVGFFKTERSKEPKITRFSLTNDGSKIKYYLKNIPKEVEPIFKGAFDKWNAELKNIVGRELLAYEVLEKDDPRNEEIVAGDIRYNVVEWDLKNKASYGGLGPSIANQFTGETLTANVLIQGPTIMKMYTEWFKASNLATELKAQGLAQEAREVMVKFNAKVAAELKERSKTKFKMKLGKSLDLNVRSQSEELEDPITRGTFEIVPQGLTFQQYMTGYFSEMLDHELGHNLGLRHNFKGNLGAFETKVPGSVSRSIMEYLGRGYRYLNTIAAYDRMALAYGYKGVAPGHKDWFCTDDDEAKDLAMMAVKSPECSKNDATNDPFSYWESRLSRALDLVLERKSTDAPVWKVTDIVTEVSQAVQALGSYALSADKTADSWTNFFGKADRPESKEGVKNYVLASLKKQMCDPALMTIINAKASDGQKVASDNLAMFRMVVGMNTSAMKLFSEQDLKCE